MSNSVAYDTFLLDGNSFGRAAFDPQHPGAMIHRVASRILTLSRNGRVIVAWDTTPDVRIERFPGYKLARRSRTWEHREAYNKERASLQRLLRMLAINQAVSPGWEADDVIATLAIRLKGLNQIQTRDEDLLQCISDRTHVLLIKVQKEKVFDSETFLAERGFEAHNIISHKALAGDVSDSIPGVKGLGDKAATEIVSKYPHFVDAVIGGTWNEPFESLDLSTRSRNLAKKAAEDPIHLETMRWIVTANVDVPIVWAAPNPERHKLSAMLSLYGLKTLAERLGVAL